MTKPQAIMQAISFASKRNTIVVIYWNGNYEWHTIPYRFTNELKSVKGNDISVVLPDGDICKMEA